MMASGKKAIARSRRHPETSIPCTTLGTPFQFPCESLYGVSNLFLHVLISVGLQVHSA